MKIHHHVKHWLVPHRHNDHRPQLIRPHGLALTMALIVAVQLTAAALVPAAAKGAPSHGAVLAYAIDITPIDLFTKTNQQRVANGLPALRLDARLNSSAGLKAQNMFAENYWAHVSPSGIQPWYWFTQAGYTYRYAGENLAKDFDTSAGVMDGWMNSAGHRANILNPNYTDVGFAVQNGTLVGGQTTLVVAHYGMPSSAPAAAPVAPVSTPRPAATARPASQPVVAAAATATPVPATPTATPAPVASASPIVAVGTVSQSAPDAKSYAPLRPLAVTRTLGWSQLASLLLLAALLLVYLWTHLVVWRSGLRRWNTLRYRSWAMVQVGSVAAIMLYFATSGFGRVG